MKSLEDIATELADKYNEALDTFSLNILAKFYSIDQLKFAFREKHKLAEFIRDEGWDLRLYYPEGTVEMWKGSEMMGRFEYKIDYANHK